MFTRSILLQVASATVFLTVAFSLGAVSSTVQAQPPNAVASTIEQDRIAIEREKLSIEKVRAAREERQFYVTIASIALPFIIVGISLWMQARTAYKLQSVEIIMNSKSTDAARKKVNILKALIPKSITREFDTAFAHEKMPGTAYQEKKIELFKAMAAKAATDAAVFQIFRALYLNEPRLINEFIEGFRETAPGADWVVKLKDLPVK